MGPKGCDLALQLLNAATNWAIEAALVTREAFSFTSVPPKFPWRKKNKKLKTSSSEKSKGAKKSKTDQQIEERLTNEQVTLDELGWTHAFLDKACFKNCWNSM